MPFFGFVFDFLIYFVIKKNQKRGFFIPQTPRRLTWRAQADVARVQADVARRTSARMRRGTEATWQGRAWPRRGAGGAGGEDTWQEATRSTRVHADAHVGRHVTRGLAIGGPTG